MCNKQKKSKDGESKCWPVFCSIVEGLLSDIRMVLRTIRVQERRQVCQVRLGAVRHEWRNRHGVFRTCPCVRRCRCGL